MPLIILLYFPICGGNRRSLRTTLLQHFRLTHAHAKRARTRERKTDLIVKRGTHVPQANTLCAWHTMRNVCEGQFLKNGIGYFAIRTLQNEDFLHFYSKIFGQFKKK